MDRFLDSYSYDIESIVANPYYDNFNRFEQRVLQQLQRAIEQRQIAAHIQRDNNERDPQRDWNEEFQILTEEPVSAQINPQLHQNFIDELIESFLNVLKPIIKELVHKPDLHLPLKLGCASGHKYIINGIFIKAPHISDGLYESQSFANKVVNLEHLAYSQLLLCRKTGLHFPFTVVVSYMGRKYLAMPLLPIDLGSASHTQVYGSADSGASAKNDPKIGELIARCAEQINLDKHHITTTEEELFLAGDVEGHQGTDGNYYVIDVARMFPPLPPDLWPKEERVLRPDMIYHCRPELVRSSAEPLNSDAFSNWVTVNKEESNQQIRLVVNKLIKNSIPALANDLDRCCSEGSVSAMDIKTLFHARGVNLVFLGTVLALVTCSAAKERLLLEAVARCCRTIIEERWSYLNSFEECKSVAANMLETLYSPSAMKRSLLNQIVRLLQKKFHVPACYTKGDLTFNYELCQYIADITGVTTERQENKFIIKNISMRIKKKNVVEIMTLDQATLVTAEEYKRKKEYLGDKSLPLVPLLIQLSEYYINRRDYKHAEAKLIKALEICAHNNDNNAVICQAQVEHKLGTLYKKMGGIDKSERLLMRSFESGINALMQLPHGNTSLLLWRRQVCFVLDSLEHVGYNRNRENICEASVKGLNKLTKFILATSIDNASTSYQLVITRMWRILAIVGFLLREHSNYREAEVTLEQAKQLAERYKRSNTDEDSNAYRQLLANLIAVHRQLGQLHQAMEHAKILQRQLKTISNPYEQACLYNNMGNICYNTGEFVKAKKYYFKAINIYETSSESIAIQKRIDEVRPRCNLAQLLLCEALVRGDFNAVREQLVVAQRLVEDTTFEESATLKGLVYNYYGNYYREIQVHNLAAEYFLESFRFYNQIYSPVNGVDHDYIARVKKDMALLQAAQNQFAQAVENVDNAIYSKQTHFGLDHLEVAHCYLAKGQILRAKTDVHAKEWFDKAKAIYEKLSVTPNPFLQLIEGSPEAG